MVDKSKNIDSNEYYTINEDDRVVPLMKPKDKSEKKEAEKDKK